jgi:glycosyltransferase involved in cell wall biosynthesis
MTQRKIRILFTIPNFVTAGSGREMVNIIERLDKDIFEPMICVETEGGATFEELHSKGYKIIVNYFTVHNVKGIIKVMSAARQIANNFKEYKIDIWQSFNWSSDFSEALIARFSGAKYVYVKKNMNWERRAWKVKSFFSTAIVARNTTMFRTFFKAPYLNRKTFYIPGGVDTEKFNKNRNTAIRTKYEIPQNSFLVTCVAQLVKIKNQLLLINAAAELKEVYVLLIGAARDEEYVTELKSLIGELQIQDRVLLAGSIPNVAELLNASDVFVLPTSNEGGHEEGSPVALLEAMASELPCIASNVAGNRDVVNTNETGILFQPDNLTELIASINKYLKEPEYGRTMASNARKQVLEENTLEIETNSFITMYKKILRIK